MKKFLALLLCLILTMSLCLALTACNDDSDIGELPGDNEQEETGEQPEDPDDEEPIEQPEDPDDEEPIEQPEDPDDDEDEDKPEDPVEVDFDKMAVKNWSNYQSIGAGYVQASTQQAAIFKMSKGRFAKTDIEVDSTPKLIGLTKDGVYEIISFVDEDNNETEQSYKLVAFSAYKHFTFVTYSTVANNTNSTIDAFDGKYYDEANQLSYIISNTGKMYKLNGTDIKFFVDRFDESADAMFISGRNVSDLENSNFIFKLSEQDGELKIDKIVDLSIISSTFGLDFFVDNHGNIFAENRNAVITVNKTIKSLTDKNVYKAANGYVYCGDQVFDNNGDLVDSDFVPPTHLNCAFAGLRSKNSSTAFLVKSEENVKYYYLGDLANSHIYATSRALDHEYFNEHFLMENPDKMIFKYTFADDGVSFTFEIIEMEDIEHNDEQSPVVANGKIYFIKSSEIYYIDIETGVKTVLNTEYIFNSIWSDNKGNICFNGVDSTLNTINGTISADDEVNVGITSNGYEVIYLKPIN